MENNKILREEALKPMPEEVLPRRDEWILGALIALCAYVYYSCMIGTTWLRRTFTQDMGMGKETFLLVFTLLFVAVALWYARQKNRSFKLDSMVYLILTVAAAVWFVAFQDSTQPISFYVGLFLHGVAVYWLASLAGNRQNGCLDQWAPADLSRGLFYLPFAHFWEIFSAAGNLIQYLMRHKQQHSLKIQQALLGAGLSIPVLCIVVPLLARADQGFAKAVVDILLGFSRIFSFGFWLNLALVTLIAMYLFGMFYGIFNSPRLDAGRAAAWPAMILSSFLAMIVAVYALFFMVKLAGVSGAMEQIADGTLLASTYARDGFFELCGIAAINFLIFSLVKWHSPDAARPMKIMMTVLGVQTLAFICLALSKMGLYIGTYGLTFKRVFTSWFMGVLFITFLLLMAEIWKRFNGVRIAVMVGAVSFLLLAYSNMPVWMDIYNRNFL